MENHTEVSRSLGRLEAGVEGINARLDKLNGSVARHEARLGTLEQKDSANDAKERTNVTWRNNLSPLIKLALAFALGLVLSHAPEMLKLVGGAR